MLHLILALALAAQEPPATPGKEHALLKKLAGTWDLASNFPTAPGDEEESKGTEVARLQHGGLWLTTDFKGRMGGQPFTGTGTMGYDPRKKKYVSTWVDSRSSSILLFEGELSPDGKTLTMKGEVTDPSSGEKATLKTVADLEDDDRRTVTFIIAGPNGEFPFGEIVYTRKPEKEKKKDKKKE